VKNMPYVFITTIFPANKTNESAKLYVDSLREFRKAQRPLTKEIIANAIKSTNDGIESIGVHDIKEGKLEEFLLLQQSYMTKFHAVEGLKYKIDVRFKATEALEMIGMNLPE
jgi:bifunctional DNase/RNase